MLKIATVVGSATHTSTFQPPFHPETKNEVTKHLSQTHTPNLRIQNHPKILLTADFFLYEPQLHRRPVGSEPDQVEVVGAHLVHERQAVVRRGALLDLHISDMRLCSCRSATLRCFAPRTVRNVHRGCRVTQNTVD